MLIQQAMINKMMERIAILEKQDNFIIKQAGVIFQGIHKQIHDSLKKQTQNWINVIESLMIYYEVSGGLQSNANIQYHSYDQHGSTG